MKKVFVYGLYLSMYSYNRRCCRPFPPPSGSSQEWIAISHLIEWDLLYVSNMPKEKQPADLVFRGRIVWSSCIIWECCAPGGRL